MRVAILSGGSGSRLWPLSNSVRSKQFLKLFPVSGGTYESMLERSYRMVHEALPEAAITITTSEAQKSATLAELGAVDICAEPCRRDTFAAICLAASYMHECLGASLDEPMVACASDANATPEFYALFERMGAELESGASLCCIGVEPSYASAKYGYVIPDTVAPCAQALQFVEKPSAQQAETLIKQGALWNAGVYAMRIGYVLDKAQELFGTQSYTELCETYDKLLPVSFDYAVAEHEHNLRVVRYTGPWSDLGTWATLADFMGPAQMGKVTRDEDAQHSLVINELGIPVMVLGIDDAIICATADGILLAKKDATSHMKPFVDLLVDEPRRLQKSWGSYEVVHVQEGSITVEITLKADHHMNYHAHEHRDESWTIVSGGGVVICDGREIPVTAGDTVRLPRGTFHSLYATSDLRAIEVQVGAQIDVRDKQLKSWDFSLYKRADSK